MARLPHVLFLCTANSCRSQMAEGLFRALAPAGWQVESAGTNPVGHVHPGALAAMAEAGIDISAQQSKGIDPGLYSRATLIVTVCGHADQRCPVPPPGTAKRYWPIDDPVASASFGEVRDEIRRRVLELIRDLSREAKTGKS